MHKEKIRQEKNATGITCEETELNQVLEEIIEKENLADEKSPRQRKKKGRRSSSGATQAKRYGTFMADQ